MARWRLDKDAPPISLAGVEVITIGVEWDRKNKEAKRSKWAKLAEKAAFKVGVNVDTAEDVDLDLAVVLYRDGLAKRICVGDNTDPCKNGSVTHSGDNTTGKDTHVDFDDETIRLDLSKIPVWVTEFMAVVMAYKVGTSFDNARNVAMKVYDYDATPGSGTGGGEAREELQPTLGLNTNACSVIKGVRNPADDTWSISLAEHSGTITQGDENSLLQFAGQKLRAS